MSIKSILTRVFKHGEVKPVASAFIVPLNDMVDPKATAVNPLLLQGLYRD